MTIAQMHTACDLLIDKANAPWFTPAEKDIFLNEAILEYVKNEYDKFEVSEKTRENLLTLVSPNFQVLATNLINLETVPNFLYVLMLNANINSPCGNLVGVPVKPVQYDDLYEAKRDPFNKPADKYPLYTQNVQGGNRTIEVFSDTVPAVLNLIYLMTPAVVSITVPTNCNLPLHTHQEIVNIAVRIMLGNVEKFQNYQVQQNEIKSQK